METIFTITFNIFTYFLVRRPSATSTSAAPVWRWAIVAKNTRSGETFIYCPKHWRETKGEESPFRPFNEWSFTTTNRIDPKNSEGWRRAS